ncbi:UNVERIFIED_CONTAM: hypothetical protein Slati_2402600 [Sesamum latifolium]|uniref:Uncharacterized protein n=1 Tax=Sesamum latifolium TaxID=2727402 RepID=A0AAW2WGX9_9LAMI
MGRCGRGQRRATRSGLILAKGVVKQFFPSLRVVLLEMRNEDISLMRIPIYYRQRLLHNPAARHETPSLELSGVGLPLDSSRS